MGVQSNHRPNSSRKGCWTCKRSHRTCDESLPLCKRCEALGIECEGYGVKRVKFRPPKRISSAQTAKAESKRQSVLLPECIGGLTRAFSLSPVKYEDQSLLRRFLDIRLLSPIQNIFEEDIAPLALYYDHVRTAILALTSALSSPARDIEAFRHYAESMQLLRQSLDVHLEPVDSTDVEASLASMYLLTWFEVITFDPQKWTVHLEALCKLINAHRVSLWQTSFGRRLIHAVSRLDCQNALSNRGRPFLDASSYCLLESEPFALPQDETLLHDNLEIAATEASRQLHGILGAAAVLSHEWTTTTPKPMRSDFPQRTRDVLQRLDRWYRSLPKQLRWPGYLAVSIANSEILFSNQQSALPGQCTVFAEPVHDVDQLVDLELRRRSHLARAILLQYFAIKVHIYHMLDPVRSPGLMGLSSTMSRMCLRLIRAFGASSDLASPPEMNFDLSASTAHTTGGPMRCLGDMPISFVLAVIGCLADDDSDRKWISNYLFQLGREGMWCGYERALCLHAWWKSSQTLARNDEKQNQGYCSQKQDTFPIAAPTKRLIKSVPLREELPIISSNWTPDKGMGVEIIFENLDTGEVGTDRYFLDGEVFT